MPKSISIHALREEGDLFRNGCFQNHPLYFYPRPPRGGRHFRRMMMLRDHEISIHALREEGDTSRLTFFLQASKFLSTPSARRATALHPPESASNGISIHALREEGDPGYVQGRPAAFCISIHALREEGDLWMICFCWSMEISIHALREEGDCKNGEKHLRFCFIIKRSAQIWKSLSKNIRKKSRDLHRTA